MKILKNIYETLIDILDYLENIQDTLENIEFNTDNILEYIEELEEDQQTELKLKKMYFGVPFDLDGELSYKIPRDKKQKTMVDAMIDYFDKYINKKED